MNEKTVGSKDQGLPYVGLEHIESGSSFLIGHLPASASISTNTVFRQNDTLFGKLRPNLRKSVIAPFDGYCSTDILVLRATDGVSPRYAGRLFHSEKVAGAAVRSAIGTGMPRTSWHALQSVKVFCPPLPEQRLIAQILDTVDEAIRKTEQLIAKLKLVKQGLLHDLLTRGIDENGELRDPERHPEQFRDSPLGNIPREWVLTTLGEVSQLVTSGSRGWAAYYADFGPLFIRIGNLTREHINLNLDNAQHVQPPTSGEGTRTQLAPRDLLISITADLGIIGVVPNGIGEAYVNQHIALARLDPSRADARWLGHYLSSQQAQRRVWRLDDPGAKAGLNLPAVRALRVCLPGQCEQSIATERLDAIDSQIDNENRLAAKFRQVKAGLMEDLLTGRVGVTPFLDSSS